METKETLNQTTDKSLPSVMDSMELYQLEFIRGSINYGRQLQLQYRRLTKKRFSVTKAAGIHPSSGFNLRRIA
jgi:hypothetical protein